VSEGQEPNNVESPTPESIASPPPEGAEGPKPGSVDAKLGVNVFKLDQQPHIEIDVAICRTVCTVRACLQVCPADLYAVNDEGDMTVNWEGCLECGTCLICCDEKALSWHYPRGGFGVQYRMS
jgi:ferredoxin like protein